MYIKYSKTCLKSFIILFYFYGLHESRIVFNYCCQSKYDDLPNRDVQYSPSPKDEVKVVLLE